LDAAITTHAAGGGGEPTRPSWKDLDDRIVQTCQQRGWSDNSKSLVANMRNFRYHEDGEFGLRSLVPHLHSAGLFELAKEVMANAYDLK
jgi:hypothetical protein